MCEHTGKQQRYACVQTFCPINKMTSIMTTITVMFVIFQAFNCFEYFPWSNIMRVITSTSFTFVSYIVIQVLYYFLHSVSTVRMTTVIQLLVFLHEYIRDIFFTNFAIDTKPSQRNVIALNYGVFLTLFCTKIAQTLSVDM